jgi:hypothetical protein
LTGIVAAPKLADFQHMEPLGEEWMPNDDWWVFLPEECPADLVWPLDVAMISEKSENYDFFMARISTLSTHDARGVVSRFSPYMIRTRFGAADRGQLLLGNLFYSWLGGQWQDARGGRMTEQDRGQPRLASAVALRQRYEWAVSLGLEDLPSVRFATDPTGIKDAFRIRDLPEGRDRRDALMNWVAEHWRQDRHDPDLETYVRRHLRGTTKFTWKGMDCTLLPSQFDIEQRDRLLAERNAMKEQGLHRRLKPGKVVH